MADDFYDTLGVSRDASDADIKSAYRKLAMKYHPDRNQGDAASEQKFKDVSQAYEILKDPKKRQTYDQFGHAAFEQGGGGAGGIPPCSSAQPGGTGGGGAGSGDTNPGTAGTANTGGGGGGSGPSPSPTGGTGGSGIVIIRYKYQ